MRAVIDTNVVISGFIAPFGRGAAAAIDQLIVLGAVRACYNESVIAEYRNVARYEKLAKYGIDLDGFEAFLEALADQGCYVSPPHLDVDVPDEDDRRFYEISEAAGCPIVTWNAKDYPEDAWLIDPAAFVEMVRAKG